MTFKNPVNTWAYFGKLSLLACACIFLVAAQQIRRSEQSFGVVVVTANDSTPVQANSSANLDADSQHYNEVCFRNMGTDASKFVYISTFSTTNEADEGWPLAGTEKECHDWGSNVRLYVFNANGEPDVEVRFIFAK